MPTREISTRGGAAEASLDALFHKLFVSELLLPSTPLWIAHAWISDVDVVDNRGGELLELAPALPARSIKLVELIAHQLESGATVNVVMRDDKHNRWMIRRLQEIQESGLSGNVRIAVIPGMHEKVIVTDHLKVTGSMNLTHNGRTSNSEIVTITDDDDAIERQRLHLEQQYGGVLA